MLSELQNFLFETGIFPGQQKILLTVSGGMDSMVMATLFLKSGNEVGIAHCNFGLRGSESDKDEEFVRLFAARNGVKFFVKSFDTKNYAHENRLSIQEAARNLRYSWFETLVHQAGYNYYATAHHFDDQIETFFINLLRGTGVSGLRGILPVNNNCIRPLLFAGRKQIARYARENDIAFREDSSNAEHNYLRNRIRHMVIPALEKASPDFYQGMKLTFKVLAQTEKYIEHQIAEINNEWVETVDEQVKIPKKLIKSVADPHFILYELLKPFGFNPATIGNIISACDGFSGKRFYSNEYELYSDRDNFILTKKTKSDDAHYVVEEGTIEMNFPLNLRFENVDVDQKFQIKREEEVAQLDLHKLKFPLVIRKVKEGDNFYPLGMKGKKKLSDFLIDKKISIPDKKKIWVIVSGGEIVWVIGQRIDERFKISATTTKALVVKLIGKHSK